MKKKPILIIILGIIHLLEPLSKILFLKFSTGFSFDVVMDNVLSISGIRNIFEFWFLFPVGGVALLSVKNWSYPVFVAVQIYSIFTHLTYEEYSWPYVQETPMASSLGLVAFNVAMIMYLLIPKTRQPFLDSRIRWWESKQRFAVKIKCFAEGIYTDLKERSEILNISLTGAFVKGMKNVNINDEVILKFDYFDLAFSVNAIVKSYHQYEGEVGWGVEFRFTNWRERLKFNKLMRILKISKTEIEGR